MRLSIVEGSLVQAVLNWTTGSVMVGYLLHLGASPYHIGLVSSVPLLAQVSAPFAAILGGWTSKRRMLTALVATLSRATWVLAAFLPQLDLPEPLKPTLLVAMVLFASVFQSAAGTLWTPWMGEVVPERLRGRYFGLRTGVVGVAGMVANLAAGAFLDHVAAPLSFQVVMGVAVVLGAIGVGLYFTHYDPPSERVTIKVKEVFSLPFKNPNFRKLLMFGVYWNFVIMLGAPFVVPYFLSELSMTFTHIALWSAIAATTGLLTTTLWGRVADRFGNKPVLAICTFIAGAGLPSMWILAGYTGNMTYIWVGAVNDAIAWGGIGPAVFNVALVTAPREGRVAYIAMYALVSGVAGFVGGTLSAPLLELFMSVQGEGARWTAYHSLFLVTGVGRMLAWVWVRRVREPNALGTRDLLRRSITGARGMRGG